LIKKKKYEKRNDVRNTDKGKIEEKKRKRIKPIGGKKKNYILECKLEK